MENLQQKWNNRYQQTTAETQQAAFVMRNNLHLLPRDGVALDLACGLGANALLMARHGLTVEAWDLSTVALQKLQALAEQQSLTLTTQCRDVEQQPPENNRFDVVTVSYFLHRESFNEIIKALKPGGLLFYQTFSGPQRNGKGPANPAFRLQGGELLNLCEHMQVLYYREDDGYADSGGEFCDQAMIVAARV